MKQTDPATVQTNIAAEMHVSAGFDANEEIERRISFLANYLRSNGLKTYVLGISGGVDSTTAGRLAQLAVERCAPRTTTRVSSRYACRTASRKTRPTRSRRSPSFVRTRR